ncbi:MAG: hypothetical protein ACPG9K_01150 [Poseidonibacter sp.]
MQDCNENCPLVKEVDRLIEDMKSVKSRQQDSENDLKHLSAKLTEHMYDSKERASKQMISVEYISESVGDIQKGLERHMQDEQDDVKELKGALTEFSQAMIGKNGDGTGVLDKINKRLDSTEKAQISVKEKQVLIWGIISAVGSGFLGLVFWALKGQIG